MTMIYLFIFYLFIYLILFYFFFWGGGGGWGVYDNKGFRFLIAIMTLEPMSKPLKTCLTAPNARALI